MKLCLSMAALGAAALVTAAAPAPTAPRGYWPPARAAEIVGHTSQTRLAPNLSALTAGEREAVANLLQAGAIVQEVFELQRHRQALSARAALVSLDQRNPSAATKDYLTLYRLNSGPIATTLDNRREPFLPVEMKPPGGGVWPWGITKAEVDAYLAAHPAEADAILHPRTVVRRATSPELAGDLATLKRYPALETLHPGLTARLTALARAPNPKTLYAVPYSVAYADRLMRVNRLLNSAAEALAADDEEFAGYLRNRARDLISDDYESGDAAWVTGHFKHLNAQIGSYETYDDELYGVKTFFAFSLLATRVQETEQLRKAMRGLQAVEDSLPYDAHKKVREDIPVGVYDVIADFGQARGGNTATILPNEAYLARRYGRTILLRANIMRDPEIFADRSGGWRAAMADAHGNELTAEGNFQRTLWHEVGHYLGVDRTKTGGDLDAALQNDADLLEEMKADLVSLYGAPLLRQQGYYTDAQVRGLYASGVNRMLQTNRPRRDQPYNTMQLIQWNWFLDKGVLRFDPAGQTLSIDYGRYHEAVGSLLKEVLAVQYNGDKAAADAFIDRWTRWDENLHGVIAKKVRDNAGARFRLFSYQALDG